MESTTRVARPNLAFWIMAAFALLVHVPALFMPFTIDDFAHRVMLEGDYPSAHPGPSSLYDFVDDANRDALMERGILPWWTHPHLVVRFLRPLSSLTLAFDYRVSRNGAWWGHLHSLLWWAAACGLVYVLLERTFSRRVAQLGVLAYALAPCHVIPLAWLANREALVSTTLGAAGLLLYTQWRRDRRARDGAAAFTVFGLAMAAGEYSLCVGAYVLAFEVVRRRERIAARATGLAPFAVPAAAYLAARAALHYGAKNGGMYYDPFWNFDGFARGVFDRFGVLFCAGWLGLDEFFLQQLPGPALGALCAGVVALLAVPVLRALRALDEPARRDAVWLLLGSFLSMVPMLAVEPSARLLGAPMIGIGAVAALVMDRAWFAPREPRHGAAELSALVALGLAFTFFVRAPVTTLLNTRTTIQTAAEIVRNMNWVRERIAGKSSVVVLRANSLTTAIFAPCILDKPGVTWRVLSYEAGRVLALRTGDRSLELVAGPRPLFPMGDREVFRSFDGSLRAGDSVHLSGMKATVLQLDKEGMAKRVRFDFDRDLDDPSTLWLTETFRGFEEQPLPQKAQGEPILP